MKTASRVFIIIGLICSLVCMGCSFLFRGTESFGLYLIYGIYAFVMSIGSLVAVNHSSKAVIVIWGILYLPAMAIASIFMFCIKREDCL